MITITYGMTGKQVREAINANIAELEVYYLGDARISAIAEGETVANFMAAMNTQLASLSLRIALLTTEYTEYSIATADIATIINGNFTTMIGEADTFLADEYPFFLDVIVATIPGKGTANILSQNGTWKLAFYGSEDILYLSNDNGVTWPYSIASGIECDNIRLAQVFNNGNVLIGTKDNHLYHSTDLLDTLTEFYCIDDATGENLVFHEPVNPLYPGAYFAALTTNVYIQDGQEILLTGNYPHWNSFGAAPINLYASTDQGVTLRCVYHFGQNTVDPEMRDDGTVDGGITGNLLGDAANETTCKHFHFTGFDYSRNEFWVQTGDGNTTTWFFKVVYTPGTDSFAFTEYAMGALSGYFRAVGLVFTPAGDYAIWVSDGNGNIYKVDYAHLTAALVNHTVKYDGARNIVGLSPYGERILALGGTETPGVLICSVDYGENWVAMPDNYMSLIGALTTKYLMNVSPVDGNGYHLIMRTAINSFYAKETFLIKINDKPVH